MVKWFQISGNRKSIKVHGLNELIKLVADVWCFWQDCTWHSHLIWGWLTFSPLQERRQLGRRTPHWSGWPSAGYWGPSTVSGGCLHGATIYTLVAINLIPPESLRIYVNPKFKICVQDLRICQPFLVQNWKAIDFIIRIFFLIVLFARQNWSIWVHLIIPEYAYAYKLNYRPKKKHFSSGSVHSFIVLQCSPVTVLQCYNVPLSQCSVGLS